MSTAKDVPKAVLYYSPLSVWSSAVLLALEEKGYGEDEIDLKIVDLSRAENFDPSFLRLNPNATVPTLVVPLQKTLSEEVESRYKAITNPKQILDFLDKSRSPLSRTNTTSNAPAPSLTPATIAFTEASKIIIDELLHSADANPANLLHYSATDDASLIHVAEVLLPYLTSRHEALAKFIADAESGVLHVSEKVVKLWQHTISSEKVLLDVFKLAGTPGDKLTGEQAEKRREYFNIVLNAWTINLKPLLLKLDKEMIGPYTLGKLGEQLSVADLHLAAWLSRVLLICGAQITEDGVMAISKLDARFEGGLGLPSDYKANDKEGVQTKFAAFWGAMRERQSWKKVYVNGLH